MVEERRSDGLTQRLAGLMLDAVGDAVMATDPDGRILYWNAGAERLYGWTRDEVLGRNIIDVTPSEQTRDEARAIMERLRRGESWVGEFQVRDKAGRRFLARVNDSPVFDERGELIGVIGVSADVTTRKQVEEALRFVSSAGEALASSLDYEETLQRVPRLAVPTLADTCVLYVAEGEEVRRFVVACVDPEKEALLSELTGAYRSGPRNPRSLVGHVLRTGQPLLLREIPEGLARRMFRDQPELWRLVEQFELCSAMMVPLEARRRAVGALVLVSGPSRRAFEESDLTLVRDLARLAALAVDNARLYRESRQAIRARDEIMAVVAHDLRNPLNTIAMSLPLLREGRGPAAERLEVVARAAQRMDALIQDLVDAASSDAGHLRLDLGQIDAGEVLRYVVAEFEPLAARKGISIGCCVRGDLPLVRADRLRVVQVLSNLIGNALKFTEAGGTVEISAQPADGAVLFRVADTGSGIAPADLPHVFDAFWQAGKKERGSLGLGLTITRGIVEAHGGRIWAESEPGRGSTFCFTIPAAAG